MTREEILNQAKEYVCKDREETYGKPESNFQVIADLWNIYTDATYNRDLRNGDVRLDIDEFGNAIYVGEFTAEDVAVMMALLKIARIATGKPKADNYTDCCGYIACAGELAEVINDVV